MADQRQDIFENVKAAFDLVLAASGYNSNIGYTGIGYKHFTEIPEDKFPALVLAGADEKRENVTNTSFKSDMEVSVVGYVRSSDANDPAILERDLNRLISDAAKALQVDPTRGGNATFTEITGVVTDKGAYQPYAMFEMLVNVEYRATFAQP